MGKSPPNIGSLFHDRSICISLDRVFCLLILESAGLGIVSVVFLLHIFVVFSLILCILAFVLLLGCLQFEIKSFETFKKDELKYYIVLKVQT